MENPELLLLELEEFNKSHDAECQISQSLNNFLEHVSKTGKYIFPWSIVKKLFIQKLTNTLNNISSIFLSSSSSDNLNASTSSYLNSSMLLNESSSNQLIKDRVIERMKSFNNAPFTIQRISELLLKPNNHYTRADKFLRGLEKCVMVVTTIDPNGNKIFIENTLTNGTLSEPSSPATTPTRPLSPNITTATTPSLSSLTTTTTTTATTLLTTQIDNSPQTTNSICITSPVTSAVITETETAAETTTSITTETAADSGVSVETDSDFNDQ